MAFILFYRANVACRNLGFDYGEVVSRDGSSSGLDIVLDNVRCEGEETELSECRHRPWGVHDCEHTDDVGVMCCMLTVKHNENMRSLL